MIKVDIKKPVYDRQFIIYDQNNDHMHNNICKQYVESKNTFILCDDSFGTYGLIDLDKLQKYPESFITVLCKYESEYYDNRMIILQCNEYAIEGIVRFYNTGKWEKECMKYASINNVIPIEYEKSKYREQYLFEFLGLPSYFTNEEIHKHNSQFCNVNRKTNKKKTNESYEEKIINDFYETVPKEYIDMIDDDMLELICENDFNARDVWNDYDFGDYIF